MTSTDNYGQASDKVLLEINAFACPYPYTIKPVSSFIYDFLQKNSPELISQYNLKAFDVHVLSLERTDIEKIMALVRAPYSDNPAGSFGRGIHHVYDLHRRFGLIQVAYSSLIVSVKKTNSS